MTATSPHNAPIIIVSADPYSALILKEILNSHDDLQATPGDLNDMWRMGNMHIPHDLLTPRRHYTEATAQIIRQKLSQHLDPNSHKRLVEYSSGNIMRIAYIHKIFPDAKIIHIARDPAKVIDDNINNHTENTSENKTSFNFVTTLRNFMSALFGKNHITLNHSPCWPKMAHEIKDQPLTKLYTAQWLRSSQALEKQIPFVSDDHFLSLSLEELSTQTGKSLDTISNFLGFTQPPMAIWAMAKNIFNSIRPHQTAHLSSEDLEEIQRLTSANAA